MNKIIFPLKLEMQGEAVADLQDGLQLFLDKGLFRLSDAEREVFEERLRGERSESIYRAATGELVALFQKQHRMNPSGEVDEPTAKALNTILEELGVFSPGRLEQQRMVAGQVRRENGQPFPGAMIRAFHADARSMVRLGEDTTDAEGCYTIRYATLPGEVAIHLRVVVFDADGKPLRESSVIREAKPLEIVDLLVPNVDSTTFQVEGKVASRVSAGVGGLRVVIVDKEVGGDVQLAQATTDESGAYQATFSDSDVRQRGKEQPDLQTRVFAGDEFLAASEIRYNAAKRETLNVLLDEQAVSALRTEYETLTGALSSHFKGKLGKLQEDDDRQDITYLANKTGWDARAVALAALADRFSDKATQAGAEIEPPFFYALFRAGLPANEDTLYHTDAKILEGIWKQAAEQGVMPKASADQIRNLVEQFQTLSAQKLLTGPTLVGTSSLKEMLSVSGLNDDQQDRFAQLYAANRTDMQAFWKAVEEDQKFGATPDERGKRVNRLQVDGKLGFLTINNAPLMQKVHTTAGANGLSDPLQLAQMGYHRAEPWSQLLTDDVPIPKEAPGDTPESKRANYANYLAAQVRLSYPTAAVAQMVKSGDLRLTGAADGVSDKVHEFLTEHQGKFEIGVQPVQQYIAQNNLQVADETVQQVKRLQRVYQITPSDQALTGLMKRGVGAAYHIVRYDKGTFVQSFAADLGGADQAALTYDKSVQIHNAVLNIALSYLNARTAPAIGVHSPPGVLDPAPAYSGDVIAYATLESLFGSIDFCACEHCRSILSPAAYLVDLLLFLHSDEQKWKDSCNIWRSEHGGAPYPFPNQDKWKAANQPTDTEISPLNVLLSRRPDIEHLPLTCENTNTALPYIDVVNETLEYYIANDVQKLSLTDPDPTKANDYQGHDTGNIASEDLLASPQFVMDSAYTTLRNESFPAPLPFHQPLENLRRYFNKFEVPLPLAMERLRKTDDLERSTNPYGWRDILMEEIGLSRAEHEILTDSTAVPLWRLYGFPNETADAHVIAGLSNAKQFARRVGITYEDLVSVLKTRFINPNSGLIPKVERLGVNFAMLAELKTKNDSQTDAKFDALLDTLEVPPDPAEYGGDIKAWVKKDDNYARIMGLITLAIPVAPWAASKAYADGDCVLPTAPQVESTLYYECTTAGTSAASEPKWPTTPGDTYKSDGTVVWTCRDASSCLSFDNLAFRYSDPAKLTQNIGAVGFVRLLRFIRLWKKLGWTIEQTDAAICALYPADLAPLDASDINDDTKLNTGFLTLLPRLGIVMRVMQALNLSVKRDLLPLLACWSEIGTYGNTALYRQMFLNPALLEQDAIFADNGYGEFLQYADVLYTHPQVTLEKRIVDAAQGRISYDDSTKRLSYTGVLDAATRDALKEVSGVSPDFQQAVDGLYRAQRLATHAEALRSAFNLTGDEYDRIVAARGYDANTTLTIPNISAIYRCGWLARKLKISVRELLLLIQFTGLDPFAAPDPTNPAILRLISLVQALKDSSLKSAAALYLIWHQDLSGKSAPDSAQITELGRTLRGDFASIDDQFVAIEDPNGDIARAHMTLVYGQETCDAFFALLDDTLIVDVAYTHSAPALEPAIIAADIRIAYDDFRHRLSHTGLLSTDTRDNLKGIPDVTPAFQDAVYALFDRSEEIKGLFFTRYPELKPPYDIAIVKPPADRHGAFLAAFQPELARRRKRQQALQRLSAAAGVDLAFTQTLLDPVSTPYPLHADGDTNRSGLDDVLALETPGLAAQFFFRDTATGKVDQSVPAAANLDYASVGSNPLPNSGNLISGIWSGQIEAPEAGFYNLVIEADIGAKVTLKLDGKDCTLTQNGNVWRNTDPRELKAGTLYEIELKVEKVKDALSLKWETPQRAREVIPSRYLYPPTILAPFSSVYVRFLKVASLAMGLDLTANEIAFFATHSDYRINADGWLNVLSVSANPASDTASKLLKPFEAVLEFARIKADLSLGDESLLAALKDPTTATQNTDSLLFTITRWNQASLNDVLTQFGGSIAGLGNFDLFRRVYDAFALIKKMGISAKALTQATTNEPTADTMRDLQAALRARYDAASWRDVVRPINDEMRSLQRDALVAYILHQMRSNPDSEHINTADKLFEYFLMDVQMDPCMQTSRIRHALSSVQLFIERCFMNLEPRVSPEAINGKQWTWMKRYRVWEANRKVYLFPENWLEPELRDNQSPFFKEAMSELLQSDITEDKAATALLNYLSKLEEVAKLEPCGIHHVEGDSSKMGDIDHVIARTAGANRKYYYRRLEPSGWTPWEQIKLDIEDNPVIPVVWKGRLFLFWLRVLQQAPLDPTKLASSPGPTDSSTKQEVDLAHIKLSQVKQNAQNDATKNTQVTVQAVLCWSEYYNGKWQPAKTSDVNKPTELGQFDTGGEFPFNRSSLQLSVFEKEDYLQVVIKGGGSWFFLCNTHSLPVRREDGPPLEIPDLRAAWLDTSSETLTIDYRDSKTSLEREVLKVLKNPMSYNTIQPCHYQMKNAWDAPFFYEDSRHVFYVTTSERPVPIPECNSYGLTVIPQRADIVMPPLVQMAAPRVPGPPPIPDPYGLTIKGPGFGVIDPSPVERFVTEDVYIRRGIGTLGTVHFGDKEIGLAGGLMTPLQKR